MWRVALCKGAALSKEKWRPDLKVKDTSSGKLDLATRYVGWCYCGQPCICGVSHERSCSINKMMPGRTVDIWLLRNCLLRWGVHVPEGNYIQGTIQLQVSYIVEAKNLILFVTSFPKSFRLGTCPEPCDHLRELDISPEWGPESFILTLRFLSVVHPDGLTMMFVVAVQSFVKNQISCKASFRPNISYSLGFGLPFGKHEMCPWKISQWPSTSDRSSKNSEGRGLL